MLYLFLNLKIKAKLLITYLFLVFLIILVVIASTVSSHKSIQAADELNIILGEDYQQVVQIQDGFTNLGNFITGYLSDTHATMARVEFIDQIDAKIKVLQEQAKSIDSTHVGTAPSSEKYRKDLTTVQGLIQQFSDTYASECRELMSIAASSAALQLYLQKLSPVLALTADPMASMIAEQMAKAVELAKAASDPTMLYVSIGLAIVAVVFGIMIAMFMSGYIARNINKLVNGMTALAEGNFTVELRSRLKDEFGTARRTLGKVRDSLNAALLEVLKSANTTHEKIAEVKELTNVITDEAGRSQNMTVTVAAASDQMVSTTSDIAHNCTTAAGAADDTNKTTEEGVAHVEEAIKDILNQVEMSKRDAENIHNLVDQSQKISTIVQTIEEIAGQTNLLALNAAIEAARAGEAGKGFAVVADEVRALASRTGSSTQQIIKMVSQIQTVSNDANESMTKSLENMNTLATKTGAISELLRTIMDKVSDVNGQINLIATAAEEQTTATGEISTNMQGVTASAQDISGKAQDTNHLLDAVDETMTDLKEKLSVFRLKTEQDAAK